MVAKITTCSGCDALLKLGRQGDNRLGYYCFTCDEIYPHGLSRDEELAASTSSKRIQPETLPGFPGALRPI